METAKKLKALFDDPDYSDDVKQAFLEGAALKSVANGDISFLNLNSPSTQKLADHFELANSIVETPERPNVRRMLYNEWKEKKSSKENMTHVPVKRPLDHAVKETQNPKVPPPLSSKTCQHNWFVNNHHPIYYKT